MRNGSRSILKKKKYWNKPKHHLSWFNYEVLCKSNWVEHKAPASYFSLNCARSKVKRITFEVFPAREGGREEELPCEPSRLCFPPNCCFPKSCSLTVLHPAWQKRRGERGKLEGVDRMKGREERKGGGCTRKSRGWGWTSQTELSILLAFREALQAAAETPGASGSVCKSLQRPLGMLQVIWLSGRWHQNKYCATVLKFLIRRTIAHYSAIEM